MGDEVIGGRGANGGAGAGATRLGFEFAFRGKTERGSAIVGSRLVVGSGSEV